MIPIVLVHGGGLDGRCWDRLLPELDGPALAVDLPGRGAHSAPLGEVTFAACADAVRGDVEAAGFDEVVLVGHSLAGCSLPSILDALGERVRHVLFVACTVPDDGRSAFDMLDPSIQQMIRDAGDLQPHPMDPAMAKVVFGNDLCPASPEEVQPVLCLSQRRGKPEDRPRPCRRCGLPGRGPGRRAHVHGQPARGAGPDPRRDRRWVTIAGDGRRLGA